MKYKSIENYNIKKFNRGTIENNKFFLRLNCKNLNFKDLKILDVGCGHGSLCVHMGFKKPEKIIGIDINKNLIEFAKNNLINNYPDLISIIDFKNIQISELDEYDFDIIVSKDTFEHIIELDKVIPEIIKRLKINGKLLLGFGPLYNSFNGDHYQTKSKIPWGHLIRNEESIIKQLNKKRDDKNKLITIYDLGLNKYSLKQYEYLLNNCGLEIIYYKTNINDHPISKIFSQISRINILKEYFTNNIYCILQKVN